MRKVLRWFFLIIASSVFIGLIIFILIRLTPLPPIGEVEYAMKTLSKAGKEKAGTYSKTLYSEARITFDSAMVNWHRENEKFIFSRDYNKVKSFAQISTRKAKLAAESSLTNSNTLRVKLKEKIDFLNETEDHINKLFSRYPLPGEIRSRISDGELLLKEVEMAYNKGQYLSANSKIADAEYLLTGVYTNATAELKNYFKSYPAWKKLTMSAINDSRKNNSYAIIIDKFSRKCYVYLGGIKKYEFDAELGRNWVGDKRRMGDKATPEGMYKIVKKYQGKETEYHKALSLDYPNKDDRERFKTEISNGTLPPSSKIGGGIEIHGGGGKGVDWTEGCIALTDSEVDIIFSLAKVGTPVTIVGSLKDIGDILVR
jgi:hypothetical protein